MNLLAERFNCFRDEGKFENKNVRFLKRAQIFVADLWAAFEGDGYGTFNDIDKITMFAGKHASPHGHGPTYSRLCRLPYSTNAAFTRHHVVLPTAGK